MPPEIPIKLSLSEMRIGADVGVQRQLMNIWRKAKEKHGHDPKNDWSTNINGAFGEQSVAKHLNHYWNGALGDYDADDVGPYQVRAATQHGYRLWFFKKDKPHRKFVLVTGLAPDLRLCGWLHARDGQKDEFWMDPSGIPLDSPRARPAFYVPRDILQPMETLIDETDS
jgi:putative component of toxin-antitoxin plasmid stabilization module